MNENWTNIRRIADKLGNDLDVDRSWDSFKQHKKKKRRVFPFWILFPIGGGFIISIFIIFRSSSGIIIKSNLDVGQREKTNANISETNINRETLDPNISSFILNENNSKGASEPIDEVVSNTKNRSMQSQLSPSKSDHFKEHKMNGSKVRFPNQMIQGSLAIGSIEYVRDKNILNGDDSYFINITKEKQGLLYPNLKNGRGGYSSIPDVTIPSLPSLLNPMDQYLTLPQLTRNRTAILNSDVLCRWSLGLSHGMVQSYRDIESNDILFDRRRLIGEKIMKSHFLDVTIERRISSSLIIGTGLNFSLRRTKIKDEIQELLSDIEYPNRIVEVLTKDGLTTNVMGTVTGTQTLIKESVRHQRYIDISIPLYFGMHYDINPSSHLLLSSGISYSIWGDQKGETYESYFSSGSYQLLDELNYRNNGHIQSLLNIKYVRSMRGHLDLSLGLVARIDLNSRIASESSVKERFKSIGITLGVNKRW